MSGGYNIHTVNEIGCKWSMKKTGMALAERKPCVVHFRERPEKAVVVEVDGNMFVKIDADTYQARVTGDISDASQFRVHSDPFEACAEGLSFELLNFPTRRWLRHSSFLLRADEKDVGLSFRLDATFIVRPVKTRPAPPTASPVRAPRATPRKADEEDENKRPRMPSTGTPAKPQRKRPAPPPPDDEFSEFKQKLARLQNNIDNWL